MKKFIKGCRKSRRKQIHDRLRNEVKREKKTDNVIESKPFSGGGPLFPGTIDLNGLTLQLLIQDLIDEFVRDGFHRILLFNAHYENEPFVVEAMDLCSGKYGNQV